MGVKTWPELNLAVLSERKEAGYRLWLVARAFDSDGRGSVDVDGLRAYAIDVVGLSRQALWRALQDGREWWRVEGGRLWYESLADVYERLADVLEGPDPELDLDVRGDHPVIVPMAMLGDLRDFRAALLATIFAGDGRLVSQERVAATIGRTRKTVRAWFKVAGVEGQETFMLTGIRDQGPLPTEMEEKGYVRRLIGGQWRVVLRRPNTYRIAYETAPFGQIKVLTREASSLEPRRSALRMYFDDVKAFGQRLQGLLEGEHAYLRLPTLRGIKLAFALCEGWTRVFGQTVPC